jgi:hypothetical protein
VLPVVLPLSTAPLYESAGLFLGTLAFPSDWKRTHRYADAYCYETLRLNAAADREFAATPLPSRPRLFGLRDAEREELFDAAEKALLARKTAYVATQAHFVEALTGMRIDRVAGFGAGPFSKSSENYYVLTNLWLKKKAGASTKPLIRDAITPSRPVIHAAFALFGGLNRLIELNVASDEAGALQLIFEHRDLFASLLDFVEVCRQAAIKAAPALRLNVDDLVQFVVS